MKLIHLAGIRKILKKHRQEGQVALIVVVLLMFLTMVIMEATLGIVGTSLKTNSVYNKNTVSLYAAEAGIQDGIWNILNKSESDLNGFFTPNTYSYYDYGTTWSYSLPNQINNYDVDIQIKNLWVPLIDDSNPSWIPSVNNLSDGVMSVPSVTTTHNIINNSGGTPNTNLIVSGGVTNAPIYNLNISYTGASDLTINSIGVWLPQGFTYQNGTSTLHDSSGIWLYSTEQVLKCAGNEAVVWTFPSGTTFSNLLSSMGQSGNDLQIQFHYSTTLAKLPQALGWITNVANTDFPYSYTWNADVKVVDLVSSAGQVEIEAFTPKSETRAVGSAISGDYVAVGNSLETGTNPYKLDTPLSNSSCTVTSIPPDATVQGAYLYWCGWLHDTTKPLGPNRGTLVTFSINDQQVSFDSNGNPRSGGNIASTRNQTSDAAGDGYSYSCYRDVTNLIRWRLQQEHPGDLSGNAIYTVGRVTGCTLTDDGYEKSHAGWSLIIIYSSPATLGHQLYLYDTFTFNPWTNSGGGWGANEDHGGDIDPTGITEGPGGTISGFIVPPRIQNADGTWETNAAKLTCFVSEGDVGYSGDFIAINAPSLYWSNPWSIPDSSPSKLWDKVPVGSEPDGSYPTTAHVQYFSNTESQPDNVWNSKSQSGGTGNYDGVDIKTFDISWDSGLIEAGNTLARIDLPTYQDSWNMVYIILSFRSSVTSGGSISYLIRRKP